MEDFTSHISSTSTPQSTNIDVMELDEKPSTINSPQDFLIYHVNSVKPLSTSPTNLKKSSFLNGMRHTYYVDWANVLKVHQVVAEDVDYMEKRWNKKVVIKGWKNHLLPRRLMVKF